MAPTGNPPSPSRATSIFTKSQSIARAVSGSIPPAPQTPLPPSTTYLESALQAAAASTTPVPETTFASPDTLTPANYLLLVESDSTGNFTGSYNLHLRDPANAIPLLPLQAKLHIASAPQATSISSPSPHPASPSPSNPPAPRTPPPPSTIKTAIVSPVEAASATPEPSITSGSPATSRPENTTSS